MTSNPFEKRFLRERKARKEAEQILEHKSLELYESHQALVALTENLEKQVAERTAEAEKEKLRAFALSKAKSEFVATMSHEIRTPINGVIGALNLLESEIVTPECHRLLSIADHSANVLLHIINDILDFSKIEAGQMDIESIPFNLQAQCDDILLTFKDSCAKKQVQLIHQWEETIPAWQLGDPFRLTQVLNNFLSNAIKFTSHGKIILKAELGESHILVSVKDTGIGISDAGLKKLFADFSQVDASTTRKFGGTGLGLVISKKIIELMGGEVGVNSVVGQGSTFWFKLPNRPTEAQETADKKPSMAALVGQSSHILLVDDNLVNRQIGQKILEKLGHQVELANNGQEAVSQVVERMADKTASQYDLVLMDCQMPVMDGFLATQAIREYDPNIPIVALTANTSQEDRQRALDSGMNEFLSKPFKVDQIQKIITSFQ